VGARGGERETEKERSDFMDVRKQREITHGQLCAGYTGAGALKKAQANTCLQKGMWM